MVNFFGRERELALLNQLAAKEGAKLVFLQGRRGIGKKSLAAQFGKGYKTFRFLKGDGVAQLIEKKLTGKILIVLEDLNPSYLSLITTLWDGHFSTHTSLIMIITSSSPLLNNNEGFIRRLSAHIRLQELSLSQMCKNKKKLAFDEVLSKCGIPKYLENDIGSHKEEFEYLLGDLPVKRNDAYRRILEKLSFGKAEFDDICKALEIKKGGTITRYLKDLREAGFIAFDHTWDLKTGALSKLCKFRLKDNFILSHLNPTLKSLQFQNLVINNRETLWKKLHIQREEIVFANPYFQRKTLITDECQIDYLIQTKRNVLYACKITYNNEDVEEIKREFSRIKLPKNFSLQPVLIQPQRLIEEKFFAHVIGFDDLCNS